MRIPSSKLKSKEEYLVAVAILQKDQSLVLNGSSKTLTLKPDNWENYKGSRGERGSKLPKQWLSIEKLSVK